MWVTGCQRTEVPDAANTEAMDAPDMNDNILLVDDDPSTIQILGRIVHDLGNVRFATNGHDALRLAHESAPDLILLDTEMPGISGFQVLEALKAEPALADVPVIFVTSHSEPEFEVAGFELGAVDFIAKPVSAPLVRARVKTQLRVKSLADKLRMASTTDALTGVPNRRRFDALLAEEWYRAQRSGDPLALLMIDVDHFKAFNDHYGHPAGDVCLRSVAQALLGATLRPSDSVARYGGEEFAMLLPKTPRDGAIHVAHGVLEAFRALAMVHEASLTASHVTVSIGIACYDECSPCWTPMPTESSGPLGPGRRYSYPDLLQAADQALYSAKSAGRARARLLDIAERDTPDLARDIAPLRHNKPIAAGSSPLVPANSQPTLLTPAPLSGVRVLAVDDTDAILEVTRLILELEGAQVESAGNGLEAFERIQTGPNTIDVVLMDMRMPVLDGPGATRRIRAELGLPDLPIIGMGAGTMGGERDAATAAGMDDYIVKPFDLKVLVSSILRQVKPGSGQFPKEAVRAAPAGAPCALPWQQIEGVNSSGVRALLKEDFGQFRMMLERLLDEFLDISIPEPTLDRTALAVHAEHLHRLQGVSGMLGASAVHQFASEAEAACAKGDAARAAQLVASLRAELRLLHQNASPLFAPKRVQSEEPAKMNGGQLASPDMADLVDLLRCQSLVAMERFNVLSPQLRPILGSESYDLVRSHIDNLRFGEAALVLVGNGRST